MQTYALTDTGRQRNHNEDSVLVESLPAGHLLAVADGMGGHAAGDVASRLAVETVRDTLLAAPETGDYESLLAESVDEANEAIRARADERQEYDGMGTTLVAAVVTDGEATIVNVGDSRAYRVTDAIEQVTRDQSLVAEMVRSGDLSPEAAADHPQRHVLSQALGTRESVDPDLYRSEFTEGTLLLCSDGLTEEVSDAAIERLVGAAPTVEDAGEKLVRRANENGGSDNVSVVLAAP